MGQESVRDSVTTHNSFVLRQFTLYLTPTHCSCTTTPQYTPVQLLFPKLPQTHVSLSHMRVDVRRSWLWPAGWKPVSGHQHSQSPNVWSTHPATTTAAAITIAKSLRYSPKYSLTPPPLTTLLPTLPHSTAILSHALSRVIIFDAFRTGRESTYRLETSGSGD